MGRKSDAKQRLLEAAQDLIWEHSYGVVTIDAICEKAGVKKGSFYYFFESKADLAVAALEEDWQSEMKPKFDAMFSASNPPMDLSIGYRIAQEAQFTAPGSFAKEILRSENGVLLLFVLSKDLRKNPESAGSKTMISTSLDRMMQQDVFRAWFEEQYKNARINSSTLLQVAVSNER